MSGIAVEHSHDEAHAPADNSSRAHYHVEKPSEHHQHDHSGGTHETLPQEEEENPHEHSHVIVFDTHPTPHTASASPFLVSACLDEKLVLEEEQRPEEPTYEFLMPPQLA